MGRSDSDSVGAGTEKESGAALPRNSAARQAIPVLILLLLAAGIRLAALMESARDPEVLSPLYDPAYNHHWAKGLVSGDWSVLDWTNDPEILTTPYGRPPGYPFFLAAVYRIFGVNPDAARVVQSILGLINLFLLYLLGCRVFGRGPAWIALLLGSLFWAFPYYENRLTYPAVSIFLVLLLLHLMVLWAGRPRIMLAAAMGFILGTFGLFRPNGLLFAPFLILWMLHAARWQRLARRWLPAVVWLTVGVLLAILPVFIRNWVVARDFVFVSAYGGLNFYAGNHENAPLTEPDIPELPLLAGIEHWSCFDYPAMVRGLSEHLGKPIRFSEANRWFYHQGLVWIWRHPLDFLRALWRKTLLFWGPVEITNDTVPELDRTASPLYAALPGFSVILTLALAGLAVWFLANRYEQYLRQSLIPAVGMLLFVLACFLSVLPYFVAGRYRMEMVPVLLLFAGAGIWISLRWLYLRQWRSVLTALLLYTSAAILAGVNWAGYTPSTATWHLRKAMAAASIGNLDTAKTRYNLALSGGADPATVWNNLGTIALREGRSAQAEDLFSRALSANSRHVFAACNLALLKAGGGDVDQALQLCRQAVEDHPRNPWAWVTGGRIAMDAGRFHLAVEWLSRAAELQPEHAGIAYDLSRAYYLTGDLENALIWGRRAAERLPGRVTPLNNLGWIMTLAGQIEEGETLLREALRVDPGFETARINLAESCLSRGNTEGALRSLQMGFNPDQASSAWWYTLGRVREAGGDLSAAEQAYRQALTLRPDFAEALNNLGMLAAQQQQSREAETLFRRAIEADPNLPQPRYNLGRLLCAEGRDAEGREVLESLQTLLGPEHPKIDTVRTALQECKSQAGAS